MSSVFMCYLHEEFILYFFRRTKNNYCMHSQDTNCPRNPDGCDLQAAWTKCFPAFSQHGKRLHLHMAQKIVENHSIQCATCKSTQIGE